MNARGNVQLRSAMTDGQVLLDGAPVAPVKHLHRKIARLCLINFLGWLATSSTWALMPQLFLQRSCADHGLDAAHCNSDDGGDA